MKRRRKSKKVSPNFAYEIGFILFMIFLFLLGLLFQNNPGYLLIIGIFLLIGGYIIYKRVRYASICRMYENDSFEKICALQPYEFEKHCADIL